VFDGDDIDAAFGELDRRYLAGEAATHAHTWSVVSRAYASMNHREMAPLTKDFVHVNHRLRTTIEAQDLTEYLRAAWDDTPDLSIRVEVVHRLSDLGSIVTSASYGNTHAGFYVEWRMVEILKVEGDLISRSELFDAEDLDAALARFEELHSETRLANAASQVDERFWGSIESGDWDALAETIADDIQVDDRRKMVSAELRHGRDNYIADLRTIAEFSTHISSTVVATRGDYLVLTLIRTTHRDLGFDAEILCVVEIDTEHRMTARIGFDIDEISSAFEELDMRYLACEAAPHAHTWSVISAGYAALNRHPQSPPAPDYVQIDHRLRQKSEAGDLDTFLHTTWELVPDATSHIEAVHRLSGSGAVVTHTAHGTSQEGFEAEWREIDVIIIEGDRFKRAEMFDEADLDAALARFEELRSQTRHPENAASRVDHGFWTYFTARDWDSIAELTVEGVLMDDRRRVVNAGVQHGRDAHIADLRAIAEFAQNTTSTVVATRGERLVLTRISSSNRDVGAEEVSAEVLCVVEIDADERIVARVGFDLDDTDAAFEELDARYIAGEAAPYADLWP